MMSKLTHPTQVVLRLIAPIAYSNRNITGDNWYSSIELIDEVRKCGLTYVGTMRTNKMQIPPQFQPNRSRPAHFFIIWIFWENHDCFSCTETRKSCYPSL
ncbi:hypothetical protein NQ314_017377 [Rhamnusium bicolor]|uniref:PiggyBac transposable element-derived protein domain-containing protein n=1 Tax=Rhamnusium bicolor TaxID=1586634 RepID=A0AAV8WT85_9CUCU|nr:hypothetical protein NQ314_017377 [Rhamnusium bicolor]